MSEQKGRGSRTRNLVESSTGLATTAIVGRRFARKAGFVIIKFGSRFVLR